MYGTGVLGKTSAIGAGALAYTGGPTTALVIVALALLVAGLVLYRAAHLART
jgi:hypothetical protein